MSDAHPLERTGDKKVAFALRATGAGYRSVVANTHGLPAGISCPGRTRTCAGPSADLDADVLERIATAGELAAGGRGRETTWRHLLPLHGVDPTFPCYVVADLRHGTEENSAYRNWRAVRPHLDDRAALSAMLGATFDDFLADADAAGVEPFYRVHWDGDIPSVPFAQALADAVRARPRLRGWLYTRSLFAVEHLSGVENLVLYVSVDADNREAAAPVLAAHPGVRVAVLAADAAAAAGVLAELGRSPAPVCPVDTGKLPVVTAPTGAREPAGGEDAVGACALCRLCVTGRGDVRFTLAKTRHAAKTVTAPVRFADDAGWEHHFGSRPLQAEWFTAVLAGLRRRLGPDLGLTWRRTYVTVAARGEVVLRAQARGGRLLVVLPGRIAGRLPAAARDISRQRHQCPGRVEVTVTGTATVGVAVGLALSQVGPGAAEAAG